MLAFVELLAGGGLLKNIKVYRAEGVTLLRCEAMPAEGHSGLLAAFSDIQWAEGLIDPHAVCGGPCVASHKVLLRILICVNGVLKHVNTPDSYLRERCANIGDSVRSLA